MVRSACDIGKPRIEVQRAAIEPITKPVKIDTSAGPPSEYEPEAVTRCLERLGQEGAFDGTLFGESRSLRVVGIEHPSGAYQSSLEKGGRLRPPGASARAQEAHTILLSNRSSLVVCRYRDRGRRARPATS